MSPEAGAHQVKRGLTWRWRDVSKAAKAAVEFAGERARRVVGAQVGGRHRWLGTALQLGNLHGGRVVARPGRRALKEIGAHPKPQSLTPFGSSFGSRGGGRGRDC